MSKYMVLYQSAVSGRERIENASPEQMQASMAEWIAWRDEVGEDKLEFGMPLTAGKHIEDGKVSDSDSKITGYSILEADSLEAATEILSGHPILKAPGTTIEVLEFLSMPGM